jgi:ATP-dependent Clp protease ATP-binding subunit ClpC
VYERFTDRARKVMQLAVREAQRFNHEYIGTEHILLGLVKEGSGVAANVLKNLDVDLRKIRLEVERIVQPGPEGGRPPSARPHTPRAMKAIECAIEEARALGHNFIGTEHLLLGLLREEESVAGQVLRELGGSLGQARDEVRRLMFPQPPDEAAAARSAPLPAEFGPLDAVIAELDRAKERAIADQEFARAAWLRDQIVQLKKVREAILHRFWYG